jgi:hypothetical protein
MKVIRELIDYFVRSSVLTQEEAKLLKQDGWIPFEAGEVHTNSDGTVVPAKTRGDDNTPVEEDEAEVEVAEPPRRAGGGIRPRSTGATAERIEAWLVEHSAEWMWGLDTLREVFATTSQILREMPPEEAGRWLQAGLERPRFSSRIWDALLFDDYRKWFDEPEARGPASHAFRALLGASDESATLKYRWMLRYPHVADAALLAGVQRSLLRGLNHLMQYDEAGIARHVQRDEYKSDVDHGFLTLVLAENARCFDRSCPDFPDWEIPKYRLPEGAETRKRCCNAIALMNPLTAVEYLNYSYTWRLFATPLLFSYGELYLRCPPSWHLGSAEDRMPDPVYPPVKVQFDESVSEEMEQRILKMKTGIRKAADEYGICELKFLWAAHLNKDPELLVQIARFIGPGCRKAFDSSRFNLLVQTETEITLRSGDCFYLYEKNVRKEMIL